MGKCFKEIGQAAWKTGTEFGDHPKDPIMKDNGLIIDSMVQDYSNIKQALTKGSLRTSWKMVLDSRILQTVTSM